MCGRPTATGSRAVTGTGVTVRSTDDLLEVIGSPPRRSASCAARGVVLHELSPVGGSLEEAYLALTQDEVEYPRAGRQQHEPPPLPPAAPLRPAHGLSSAANCAPSGSSCARCARPGGTLIIVVLSGCSACSSRGFLHRDRRRRCRPTRQRAPGRRRHGRHRVRPAGQRRARGARDHRRVRHRDDPLDLRRRAEAPARDRGQGARLRRDHLRRGCWAS